MHHNPTTTQPQMQRGPVALATWLALAAGLAATALPATAQNFPITPGQRATAQQVAQAGVPLSELAPNAPDSYTVRAGDTLWAISGLFLRSPWRWPELWGMNLQDIRNPHLIYPGQQLFLERANGRATLRTARGATEGPPTETIRVTPRTRYEALSNSALPTVDLNAIEQFLAEPIVVDAEGLNNAARIVATREGRVLLAGGDRAYARGTTEKPLVDVPGPQQSFRLFRNTTPLRDPVSGELLGYEAQYIGQALLTRSEGSVTTTRTSGSSSEQSTDVVPATIDVVLAKEEIRVGDRLLPEPPRELVSYSPHAPSAPVDARVVSVYGSAVVNAAQSQVVAINRGTRDGIDRGTVLAILTAGERMVDSTDPARPQMQLPDERNGLLLVFRTFERVSYALVLDIKDTVRVGDRLVNPR